MHIYYSLLQIHSSFLALVTLRLVSSLKPPLPPPAFTGSRCFCATDGERAREPEPEGARLSYGPSHEVCVILFWSELSGRATKQKWPFYFSVCLLHLRATRTLVGNLLFFSFFTECRLIADRCFVETFGHYLEVLSCTACQ